MNRGAIAIAAAAIATVSFAIGRATVPPPRRASPERTRPISSALEKREPEPTGDALRQCETKLSLAEGILRAQEHEKIGDPVPFPDDLPEHYRPEGFEDAVRHVLDECAPTSVALHHVDCSEYPCMVFFRQPRGSYNHAMESLGECTLWTEQFGRSATSGNNHFITDAGIVEYSYASPMPGDQWLGDENLGKRVELRAESGREQLMADVGGRELTDLEKVDFSISFFREVGGADDMVEMLEEQRAALLAAPDAR